MVRVWFLTSGRGEKGRGIGFRAVSRDTYILRFVTVFEVDMDKKVNTYNQYCISVGSKTVFLAD